VNARRVGTILINNKLIAESYTRDGAGCACHSDGIGCGQVHLDV
jgi:hypothetical protein